MLSKQEYFNKGNTNVLWDIWLHSDTPDTVNKVKPLIKGQSPCLAPAEGFAHRGLLALPRADSPRASVTATFNLLYSSLSQLLTAHCWLCHPGIPVPLHTAPSDPGCTLLQMP